jgi:hypothetical protein
MNFYEAFSYLRGAGIKALPVPGTNKYQVSFGDGGSMYIREKTLIKLAKSSSDDVNTIIQNLRNLRASGE